MQALLPIGFPFSHLYLITCVNVCRSHVCSCVKIKTSVNFKEDKKENYLAGYELVLVGDC